MCEYVYVQSSESLNVADLASVTYAARGYPQALS